MGGGFIGSLTFDSTPFPINPLSKLHIPGQHFCPTLQGGALTSPLRFVKYGLFAIEFLDRSFLKAFHTPSNGQKYPQANTHRLNDGIRTVRGASSC